MLPWKALAGVRREPRRVVVAAAVEEEGGDRLDLAAVEPLRPGERALHHVDDADHDRREAGPLDALARGVDLAAVLTDPAQPGRARVALGDRVRGDQAEGAALAQQVERAPEEVGDEVGVAVALLVQRPAASRGSRRRCAATSSCRRRTADSRRSHRSPDSPARTPPGTRSPSGTARAAARRAAAPRASRGSARPRRSRPRSRTRSRFASRSFGFSALEERRQHEIAEEPHLAQLELRLVPQVAQLPVGDALVRLADASAAARRPSPRARAPASSRSPPGSAARPASQWKASICFRESPTSESPCRSAWSTKVSAWSFASVTSQSETLARSTATGFRSTP